MHLSLQEQQIYNTYLKCLRHGKPFTVRKNFDKITDKQYVALKRLALFFNSLPNIRIEDFFNASFENEEYLPLESFRSQRAVKLYNIYIHTKLKRADNDWTIQFVRDSLVFILEFCKHENISPINYLNAISIGGIPWFVIHIKQFNVCIYLLLAFEQLTDKLLEYNKEVEEFLGKEFLKSLQIHRSQFTTSTKCKLIARKGLEILFQRKCADLKQPIEQNKQNDIQ
jgi:hypothetical protein